jgi:TolB-like protein
LIFRFDEYALDTDGYILAKEGEPVPLEPQVFGLLQFLVQNRDRVVSKDDLIEHVWDGRIVSDAAITSAVNLARRAVDDDGKTQAVIKTFPRRGFRFVAAIAEDSNVVGAPAPVSSVDKPSIAVLPFENLSADPEQEYFSDGVAEDIISALSHMRQFFVVARNSSFFYKGQSPDIRKVAEELGARYVLEGSIRKAGNKVRISAQLIDGETGNHLWAQKYDRELEDIFAVQDEITLSVVGAIEPELTRSEIERARRKPANDLGAWELYQRGLWHYFRITKDDYEKAIELFSKAIELDPNFIYPHVGLAECYSWGMYYGFIEYDREYGRTLARRAVELAPEVAQAHVTLGFSHYHDKDHVAAIAEYNVAIQLNPSAAQTYGWLGFSQSLSGSPEDGLENLRLAIKLSPRDTLAAVFFSGMAITLIFLERHEESVEWAQKTLQHPHFPWQVRAHLTSALAHLGRDREAKSSLAGLLGFNPDISISAVKQMFATTDGPHRDHYLDGLRKAGLPEG